MALLKRKDQDLTTADLAGRGENTRETTDRPQLVQDQQRTESDVASIPVRSQTADPLLSRRDSNAADNPIDENILGSDRVSTQTEPNNVPVANVDNTPAALFSETEVGDYRSRWSNVQAAFVDEPRRAVEDADNLVASLMKKLAEGFANERGRLEKQWDRGDNVSTEDLRIALQRYRSFFDRLLKV
jgi:hypothetical protein